MRGHAGRGRAGHLCSAGHRPACPLARPPRFARQGPTPARLQAYWIRGICRLPPKGGRVHLVKSATADGVAGERDAGPAVWSAADLLGALPGSTLAAPMKLGASVGKGPVSTDTRMLPSRAWFLALRGSRVDGHSYARAAIEAGCLGIVVDRAWAQAAADVVAEAERRAVAVVCVPDTASAVLDLGRASRVALGRRGAVVVGVTGSCGKTTTKEVAAACLAAQGASVHKTRGNENNLVGLPLTLLAAPQTSQAVVLEMGMSGPGEIAALTSASDPDVRVFTGVAEAHLAGCGGTVAGVAACKMEGLGAPGQAKPPVVILSAGTGDGDAAALSLLADFARRCVAAGVPPPPTCVCGSPEEVDAAISTLERVSGCRGAPQWVRRGVILRDVRVAWQPDTARAVTTAQVLLPSLDSVASGQAALAARGVMSLAAAGRNAGPPGPARVGEAGTGRWVTLEVPGIGLHNARNAALALLVVMLVEGDVSAARAALASSSATAASPGRLCVHAIEVPGADRGVPDTWVVDDSYNCNPASLWGAFLSATSLLGALRGAPPRATKPTGRLLMVLGDMQELGEESVGLHQATLARMVGAIVSLARHAPDEVVRSSGSPGVFLLAGTDYFKGLLALGEEWGLACIACSIEEALVRINGEGSTGVGLSARVPATLQGSQVVVAHFPPGCVTGSSDSGCQDGDQIKRQADKHFHTGSRGAEGSRATAVAVAFENPADLCAVAPLFVQRGDVVVVKGSRGTRMERALHAILAHSGALKDT